MTTDGAPGAASNSRSGFRLSADERRREIIAAAVREFARGGFAGTSTEVIARRVGISQPYLFRLFQTKKDLFLAAVGSCFESVGMMFEAVSEGLEGKEALHAMGAAYLGYLANVDLLLLQLHAYAACAEPEIREFVGARFGELVELVSRRAGGLSPEEQRGFFGMGMLCNVVAALGLEKEALWAGVEVPTDSSPA